MSIPNKSNFRFPELTPITGVKPYVLRYWETEFPEISPLTSEKGEKIYARSDVDTILKIKKLLFEDKLSIPEAKLKLQQVSDIPTVESTAEASSLRAYEARSVVLEALELVKSIKAKRNW